MAKFERYDKYLVIKREDIDKYLGEPRNEPENLAQGFWNYVESIENGRLSDGKKSNTYVVVNEDVPYAGKVWSLIQEQWEKENP